MRATLVTDFYDTLDYCLGKALEELLGTNVAASVYGLLSRNGIPRLEIANRFDEAVEVMVRVLGSCSRVLVHRTISEMYKQYSLRFDFSYQDSLKDRLVLLKENVLSNHLIPKRLYEGTAFDVSEYYSTPTAKIRNQ